MDEGVVLESVYKIFTARAAAELTRQQLARTVADLVAGLSDAVGEEALRTLVKSFASVLGVREAFVTECREDENEQLHMLAWWRDGRFEGERDYALAGSVCEETVRDGKLCYYPEGVGERFPRAKPLAREAYLGVPCRDSHGRIVGHIACCHDRPLRRDLPDEAILRLSAERASLALERHRQGRERHPDHTEVRA